MHESYYNSNFIFPKKYPRLKVLACSQKIENIYLSSNSCSRVLKQFNLSFLTTTPGGLASRVKIFHVGSQSTHDELEEILVRDVEVEQLLAKKYLCFKNQFFGQEYLFININCRSR